MRLKLISCEIFYREMCAAVARSPHQIDIEFLSKGLHDIGAEGMRSRLQEVLDRPDESRYEAVLFGYGLCGNGLAGLTARSIPIVLPRAHDCITLFLGAKERYLDYFQSHPGVYFRTTGWIERGGNLAQLHQLSIQNRKGMVYTYEQLVERYGEENARYIYEQLGDCRRNYQQLTFIEMGVEPDGQFERQAREEAVRRGWKFEKVQGDLSLIERLVNGQWDEKEFLVVPPGWRVVARHDEQIIGSEPGTP
ncbi:MAG: DUF1638 domain-containing protein [Acidobacteria bacterium]|nr:DUF1638 domain-containing protein [Acidobacteriota bacterium]